jgi:hypothetical protein
MSCSDHLGRTKRRAALLFVVVVVAGGLVHVAIGWAAPAEDVTLRLERFYDNACRCYKLRFSGTIASRAANEYVAVLQQRCGSTSSTAVAGASTREGGIWEAEPVTGARPGQDSSTYRARWNGRLSEPLTFRADLPMTLTRLPGRRYRVSVSTGDTRQNLAGRIVELQRLTAGQWRRVRRTRLVRAQGSAGAYLSFSAVFTVRARGLTVRVWAPSDTASPCYAASASGTWVSGRSPGTSSASGARIIDRTLLCSTAMRGGIRQISIQASAAARPAPGGASFTVLTSWVPDGRLTSGSTAGLLLNPTRCTPTRANVPLAAAKLEGGSPGTSGQEFDCETPRRVLLRVRAEFRVPTPLETSREWGYPELVARGEVTKASLAIRTQAGKPLAFATVSASGKARLLTAPSCIEDTNSS